MWYKTGTFADIEDDQVSRVSGGMSICSTIKNTPYLNQCFNCRKCTDIGCKSEITVFINKALFYVEKYWRLKS